MQMKVKKNATFLLSLLSAIILLGVYGLTGH